MRMLGLLHLSKRAKARGWLNTIMRVDGEGAHGSRHVCQLPDGFNPVIPNSA